MRRIIQIFLLVFVVQLQHTSAQEFLTGLQSNPEINSASSKLSFFKSKGIADTIDLPFFDDFSFSLIYPSDSLWADNFVYINNTYASNQLSIGVATFDALDARGLLYEHASTNLFEADHLTSRPINLEGNSSDNFYLSFFYQPQGILDAPSPKDSLTLQFWSVDDDMWYSVWKADGSEVHPFKPVIIHIDDSKFTVKGFRFRFINYATLADSQGDIALAGNADFWNIDYVHLDRNRNQSDTILHDVAFTKPLRSVLNNYESMPWGQFRNWYVSILGPPVSMSYINNDDIVRNVSRSFYIRDVYNNSLVHTFPPLAKNVQPGDRETYDAPLSYVFNTTNTDSALFEITATMITDIFDKKVNDTIKYLQRFQNYFAVDDGSSEMGYGINGGGAANSMAVYRFKSFEEDTIRAISICFNDSYLNANQRLFDLVVLSSENQIPNSIIYEQEEAMVDPGESINGFITYHLNDPVPVNGDFFVGWRQRSETWLNAGVDLNTPHNGRHYFYFGGVWNESSINGSIMIRPIVGQPLVSTGIEDNITNTPKLIVWPNPVSDILNIDLNYQDIEGSSLVIYDINGRQVKQFFNQARVDVSDLPEGIYLITHYKNSLLKSRSKFVKTR